MTALNREKATAVMTALEHRTPLQPLAPAAVWDESLEAAIALLAEESLEGADTDISALLSGLHLWNDSLDRSHTISQDIGDETGSYWHGIMHRMEGDYSNAKYWFHQAGRHAAMGRLHQEASAWLRSAEAGLERLPASDQKERLTRLADGEAWNPFLFIDAVAAQVRGQAGDETRTHLERLQKLEMAALVDYCFERAVGGGA